MFSIYRDIVIIRLPNYIVLTSLVTKINFLTNPLWKLDLPTQRNSLKLSDPCLRLNFWRSTSSGGLSRKDKSHHYTVGLKANEKMNLTILKNWSKNHLVKLLDNKTRVTGHLTKASIKSVGIPEDQEWGRNNEIVRGPSLEYPISRTEKKSYYKLILNKNFSAAELSGSLDGNCRRKCQQRLSLPHSLHFFGNEHS